jgi:hypothetical protein
MTGEQCDMCDEPATGMFRRLATDELISVCDEHTGVLQNSVERSMRELEQIAGDDEFADLRRRRTLTPAMRAKLVEAWKRATAAGKLKKVPMRIEVAVMLLDASIGK